MNYLYTFIICFLIIYLTYFLIVVNRKKGIDKFKKGRQVEFFKQAYKLDFREIDIKKFANSLALVNAFIMSFTITVIEFIDNFVLKLFAGFILLIPLMVIMYKILGNSYKKKEGR